MQISTSCGKHAYVSKVSRMALGIAERRGIIKTQQNIAKTQRTLIAACKERAISLSCSSLGLLPRISGSQNCPTAPFMWPIFPWVGEGALTHWEGSRPTPQTM